MKFATIKNRLVFTMSLFVGLSLGITALGTYLYFKEQTRSLIQSQQITLLSTLAKGLDEKLTSSHESLIAVAGVLPHKIFNNAAMAQAWLDDRKGIKQIFNDGLFLFTAEGKLLVETPQLPGRRGRDFSFREYCQKTVATKKPYISSPYISSRGGHAAIMMTAPIVAADGRLIGILGGAMNLLAEGSVFRTLIETRVGKTGYLYLYATDRTMIAHPDPSRVMKKDVPLGVNKLFDKAIEGFEGSGETVNSMGLHAIATFKRLRTTGWILASNYPVAEAYQPITVFRNYYLLGMLIFILLAVVLARRLGIGIIRPLTDMVKQIQDMAQFDSKRETRLESTHYNELKLLADAFNTLLDELRRREEALRESELLLESAFNALPHPFAVINADDFTVELANKAFGGESAQGKKCYGVSHHRDTPCSGQNDHCPLPELRRTGQPFTVEHVHFNEQGRQEYIEIHAYPLFDGHGQLTRFIESGMDITERKRMEEKFHNAQKMESVGRLAGGVAHELNNKLSVVLGYTELLKLKFHDNQQVLEQLNEISNSGEHARNITAQLLTFSCQQIISPGIINVAEVLKNFQLPLHSLLGEDIVLSIELEDNLWHVMIDAIQLNQIVMNLATNSREAMPDGGELKIVAANTTFDAAQSLQHCDASPGDYVQLTFSDSGCGMSKETLKHIFDPFYTTKGLALGTGLGLATIYGIVAQNNGFITVDSEPGVGTIFRIHLPRFEEANDRATLAVQETTNETATILLVEDDENVRKVTTAMLEQIGYKVLTTETPMEAVRLCENVEIQFDMVITDIIMPGMNGKEMMATIEMIRPGMKVLYLSGYSAEIIAEKGIIAEETNFLQKPFDMNRLQKKIREVLYRQLPSAE